MLRLDLRKKVGDLRSNPLAMVSNLDSLYPMSSLLNEVKPSNKWVLAKKVNISTRLNKQKYLFEGAKKVNLVEMLTLLK